MEEKPKKHNIGSGTNYWCTECKPNGETEELNNYSEAKKHYGETEHPILISTYFNAVYGTEDQAQDDGSHYDY